MKRFLPALLTLAALALFALPVTAGHCGSTGSYGGGYGGSYGGNFNRGNFGYGNSLAYGGGYSYALPVVVYQQPIFVAPAPQTVVAAPQVSYAAPVVASYAAPLPVLTQTQIVYLQGLSYSSQIAYLSSNYGSIYGNRLFNQHFGANGISRVTTTTTRTSTPATSTSPATTTTTRTTTSRTGATGRRR